MIQYDSTDVVKWVCMLFVVCLFKFKFIWNVHTIYDLLDQIDLLRLILSEYSSNICEKSDGDGKKNEVNMINEWQLAI